MVEPEPTPEDADRVLATLRKPLHEWTLDESEFALPAIWGLGMVMQTVTPEDEQEARDNSYLAALADVFNHIRDLGGHVHSEGIWRPDIVADMEWVINMKRKHSELQGSPQPQRRVPNDQR